jgi:hypothetical protein
VSPASELLQEGLGVSYSEEESRMGEENVYLANLSGKMAR